ncbi:MAG: hypothetical protein ACR2KX_05430 [Chitinophagaceae bacterium]
MEQDSLQRKYSGKVILFQASETYGYKNDSHMGWSEIFTGEVKKFVVNGEHLGLMIDSDSTAQIAKILNTELLKINPDQ